MVQVGRAEGTAEPVVLVALRKSSNWVNFNGLRPACKPFALWLAGFLAANAINSIRGRPNCFTIHDLQIMSHVTARNCAAPHDRRIIIHLLANEWINLVHLEALCQAHTVFFPWTVRVCSWGVFWTAESADAFCRHFNKLLVNLSVGQPLSRAIWAMRPPPVHKTVCIRWIATKGSSEKSL